MKEKKPKHKTAKHILARKRRKENISYLKEVNIIKPKFRFCFRSLGFIFEEICKVQ